MALQDGSVILPGVGHILVAPVGTAFPTDPASVDIESDTPVTGWDNLGHTSKDTHVILNRDATQGDVKGTWQNPNLRKAADTVAWSLSAPALQVTNLVLDMYFGDGDKSTAGHYGVSGSEAAIERALYLLLVDGNTRAGFGFAKASITGDDNIEFDPENFVTLAVKATILKSTGSNLLDLYAAGLGLATP